MSETSGADRPSGRRPGYGRRGKLAWTGLAPAGWALLSAATATAQTMTAADAMAAPRDAPDHTLSWGDGPLQLGELRLPPGPGPHPVAVLVHGGCWLAEYDRHHVGPLARALADAGVATWSLEYRRVGDAGGGWPGTFTDVARGADHLRALATRFPLNLERAFAIGHSAGGQLALWLATRSRLEPRSELSVGDPLPLTGVLALAGVPDLARVHGLGVCGDVVDRLMGGSPSRLPERYAAAAPSERLPIGVEVVLVNGAHDPWAETADIAAFARAARAAGDRVEVVPAPDSGHFEMITPGSSTWPLVRDAARRLAGLEPGPQG